MKMSVSEWNIWRFSLIRRFCALDSPSGLWFAFYFTHFHVFSVLLFALRCGKHHYFYSYFVLVLDVVVGAVRREHVICDNHTRAAAAAKEGWLPSRIEKRYSVVSFGDLHDDIFLSTSQTRSDREMWRISSKNVPFFLLLLAGFSLEMENIRIKIGYSSKLEHVDGMARRGAWKLVINFSSFDSSRSVSMIFPTFHFSLFFAVAAVCELRCDGERSERKYPWRVGKCEWRLWSWQHSTLCDDDHSPYPSLQLTSW